MLTGSHSYRSFALEPTHNDKVTISVIISLSTSITIKMSIIASISFTISTNTCRQRSTSTRSLGSGSRAPTRGTRVCTWWRRCSTTTTPSHPQLDLEPQKMENVNFKKEKSNKRDPSIYIHQLLFWISQNSLTNYFMIMCKYSGDEKMWQYGRNLNVKKPPCSLVR